MASNQGLGLKVGRARDEMPPSQHRPEMIHWVCKPYCFCQTHGDVDLLRSWTSDEIKCLRLRCDAQDAVFCPSESDGDREHEAQGDRDPSGGV